MLTRLSILCAALVAAPLCAAPSYRPAGTIVLGAPDRWDYAVFDAAGHRLYVAHGDRVAAIDPRRGTVIGSVTGMAGGTHGIAISHATGQGFTDDGRAGVAVPFSLGTLKAGQPIKADDDADAITFEPISGHVFVVEGDPGAITVIDPRTDKAVATIKVGEKLEYAVAAGGRVFVAGEANGDLVAIDARTNKVLAHWAAPHCTSPHGLAYDAARARLFMGCANAVMIVADAKTGKVVTELPIGRGNDAVAYDPVRRRVFSSNGVDGTISVYQQNGADSYAPLDPVTTAVSGRTMTLDPATGRLFVVAADTDPNPKGGRPIVRPGTVKVLMFDPAG